MRQTFVLLTCYALSPRHGFAVPAPSQRGPFMALRVGAIGAHRCFNPDQVVSSHANRYTHKHQRNYDPDLNCRFLKPSNASLPIPQYEHSPFLPVLPCNARHHQVQLPNLLSHNKNLQYNPQWLFVAETEQDTDAGTHTIISVPMVSCFFLMP